MGIYFRRFFTEKSVRNKEYRKICTEYTTGERIVHVHVVFYYITKMSVEVILLYSFSMLSRKVLVQLYTLTYTVRIILTYIIKNTFLNNIRIEFYDALFWFLKYTTFKYNFCICYIIFSLYFT